MRLLASIPVAEALVEVWTLEVLRISRRASVEMGKKTKQNKENLFTRVGATWEEESQQQTGRRY